jgi:hypothetical protein
LILAGSLESKFLSGNTASTSTDAKTENCIDDSNLNTGPNTRVVKILKQNEPLVILSLTLKFKETTILKFQLFREPLSGMKVTESSLVGSSKVGLLKEVDNFFLVRNFL